MGKSVSLRDGAMFVALTIMWGSAYGLIAIGLKDMPPEAVVAGRLWVAAAFLLAIMRVRGERLPALSDYREWGLLVAMGLTGSVLPFLSISHAEATVSSSLAALFVASVPIIVAIGVHVLFPDERLTMRAALGVALGFAGMIWMAGEETLTELMSGNLNARALLLAAAVFYAASTLIARGAPPRLTPFAFAGGFVLTAAVMSLAALPFADWNGARLTVQGVLAVIGLGLFPSALAQVGYIALIRSAGATFLSLTNYTIPIWAALLGWLAFGDRIAPSTWGAFALILAGVFLARSGRRRAKDMPAQDGPAQDGPAQDGPARVEER